MPILYLHLLILLLPYLLVPFNPWLFSLFALHAIDVLRLERHAPFQSLRTHLGVLQLLLDLGLQLVLKDLVIPGGLEALLEDLVAHHTHVIRLNLEQKIQ